MKGITRGMHNRLRNKERESFRRCLIQGYIFLSGRERKWHAIRPWNYPSVARGGGRHCYIETSYSTGELDYSCSASCLRMKYSSSRFYGNNKRADFPSPPPREKTFVNVDLEEKKGRIESEGEEVKKLGSEFKRESYGLMLFLTGI